MLASEHSLSVAYFLEDTPPGWHGTAARVVGPDTTGEPAAGTGRGIRVICERAQG